MTQQNNSTPTPEPDRSFVREALDRGDPTGWFDELYSRANGDTDAVPWANLAPRAPLAQWLDESKPQGEGRSALVVACGLGDGAEALADCGFDVTAFDISPTAIEWAKRRFPDSKVAYVAANMFEPPAAWIQAFDFVLEVFTVQALPIDMRSKAVVGIAQFVAPDGELLVVTSGTNDEERRTGPPWPLTRAELDLFQSEGLTEVTFDVFPPGQTRPNNRWRALYRREKSAAS